jgi:hypothetical protein
VSGRITRDIESVGSPVGLGIDLEVLVGAYLDDGREPGSIDLELVVVCLAVDPLRFGRAGIERPRGASLT